ncbi:hypothetical protein Tco_0450147 [Tanacetum coccineum]
MMAPFKKSFRSSSSEENKKMKSMMIGDDDEIKATPQKLMLDFHKKVEAAFRNPGSGITGSARKIRALRAIGRSMSSGGGLSIPCLTSILNLNTNSGFGNLNV